MKRQIVFLLSLISFVAINAQELVEVMKIEMQDTVLTLKVSDIRSFSFDKVEMGGDEEPESELSYELRVLTFEDEEEYLAYLEECFMTDAVLRFNTALESCFYRHIITHSALRKLSVYGKERKIR